MAKSVQSASWPKVFHSIPTFKSLDELDMSTFENTEADKYEKYFPKIMRNSPDGGDYLVNQPIPKCGAFCYLVIVTRPPEEELKRNVEVMKTFGKEALDVEKEQLALEQLIRN